ncbi:ATP-dependent DNA helicase [Mycena venus]|uniref:ATP-dependent DNA helicase n=1 Tax=Mycena venus TaxID=2733690 RepID=A0A8H6Z4R8_9AGAR|nr:ATP-dependent DNA helicase [Mycena venus]
MDVDEPPRSSGERDLGHSRVLQALNNGLLTPPRTQHNEAGGNTRQNAQPRCASPNAEARADTTRCRRRPAAHNELFMIARGDYHDPPSRHDLGQMDDPCPACGALHWEAEKVSKPPTESRSPYGLCCNHGKVALNRLERPPEPLDRLFLGSDVQSRDFREHITQYNDALAFTSLGVNDDKSINRHGPNAWIFRILGNLCHLSGALTAPEGTAPSYSQLYMYDPTVGLQQRMNRNSNLRQDTMESLQTLLSASHPYATIYKQALEILEDLEDDVQDAEVRLRVFPGNDRRRYNLPTAEETSIPHMRLSIMFCSSREANMDGTPDLYLDEPEKDRPGRLTQTRYHAFRLFTRETEFSTVLRGGRLLQEYMVDAFASIDQNRLSFLRHNQKKLRASVYSGLEDAISNRDDDVDLNELGKRYILPSSYIGGPRHMQQRYQDAMAIARYFRKWSEITSALLHGQTSYDRPELVARVFELKKKAIIKEIHQYGIFGECAAFVYTIEFQKRGLPHMHLLIFLRHPHKLLNPDDIDSAIWAKWPDPESQPLLFDTVQRCMVHGPCGALNPRALCMENGRCTKFFPKPFQAYTSMDTDGYPLYQRPEDGRVYTVGRHTVDNSWIVPYSPIPYPFKYIHKGGDRATLEIDSDEIKTYIDGRYIGPPEAAWRIFHFDPHTQIPNVIRLPVHLAGQHQVTFDPDEDANDVLERAANEVSKLQAFFAANRDEGRLGEEARKYTYQEFPQFFTWKAASRGRPPHWAIRKSGWALGRMYFVAPSGGERFYLRTLLSIVKGPRSHDDLYAYQGIRYESYRQVCLARGLLQDDGEWRLCLAEAAEMQTGTRLRHLFATLLLFCNPSDPSKLWEDFRFHICDDLNHRLRCMGFENPTDNDAYDYGLFLLNGILQEAGRTLTDFEMPVPERDWTAVGDNPLIAEQLDYNQAEERAQADANFARMNPEQKDAFNRVIESVENNLGKVFFLSGAGGTGKTFVYNTLAHHLRRQYYVVLCVASSGISALLLQGGRTAHSVFKIPIDGLNDESTCSIPKESLRAGLMRATKLGIWDEAPMHNRKCHEAVDRTLRDLLGNDKTFGGITFVLGGDPKQILPVVPKGTQEEIIDASIFRSYLWQNVEILTLTRNMRLDVGPEESQFAEWLLDIGYGRTNRADNTVDLPPGMACRNSGVLIDSVFPGIEGPIPPPNYFLERTILAARNGDVDDLNDTVLSRMPGDSRSFISADNIITEAGADDAQVNDAMPLEYLRSLDASGLPPGELTLKPGCPVILLRNLAPSQGLCNGTRMVIRRMSDRVLEAEILGGQHNGEVVFIPRITLTPSGSTTDFSFILSRLQFPIRLAFAISINKAQGQSVKYVGIDLRTPVFSHGQLYVALSRATSQRRVTVLLPPRNAENRTINVVYPQIFQ